MTARRSASTRLRVRRRSGELRSETGCRSTGSSRFASSIPTSMAEEDRTMRISLGVVAVVLATMVTLFTVQLASARVEAGTGATTLSSQLAAAHLATAKYANNLALAKHDGYGIITKMIPDMGYHYLNPK